tara:strand:- start:3466 stop:6630 length:3165 start_codon:yes stop_codon:yes gene_type:complete
MADTRGTWSLSEAWAENTASEWVPVPNVYLTPAETSLNTGYWVGGAYNNSQSVTNTVDKTNMATFSTAVVPGMPASSPTTGYNSGGTSGSQHGYLAGRYPGYKSDVSKLIYATDTMDANKTHLSGPRGYTCGTNSATAGYICGGQAGPSPTPQVSICDKITNSTDSLERLPGCDMINGSYMQMAACGNEEYGYICGGGWPRQTSMAKLDYYTETNAKTPTAFLTQERTYFCGTSNASEGYWYAGYSYSAPVGGFTTSAVEKTTFATDTTASNPSPMSYTASWLSGNGNTTHAMVGGGYINGVPSAQAYNSRMDKVTYASGTISNSPGSYTSINRRSSGTTGARNNGGGTTYDGDKIRWVDNADQTPKNGYCTTGEPYGNVMQKLTMPTDTVTQLPGPAMIQWSVYKQSATGNTSHGYWAGGLKSPGSPDQNYAVSVMQKFVYATDQGEHNPTRYMPTKQLHMSAGSNTTHGYFFSGIKQPGNNYDFTQIYKLTYSTDSVSSLPSHMTAGAYYAAATNSPSSSYICGQDLEQKSLKLTFSTDTNSLLNGAFPLAYTKRNRLAASGTSDVGYWGGGQGLPSPGSDVSNINKLTFSTETGEAAPGGLSHPRMWLSAVSNTDNGYWLGGYPQPSARVDKTVWSTETTAQIPALDETRFGANGPAQCSKMAATGPQSDGVAGIVPSPPAETPSPQKSDFPLPTPDTGYFIGGMNAGNIGYPSQPPLGNQFSLTDKITFASETVALAPNGNMTVPRYFPVSMSSVTTAYIFGGFNAPSTPNPGASPGSNTGGGLSTQDKIPYATDTVTHMGGSPLGGKMWEAGGNNTVGYFVGSGGAGSGGPYNSQGAKITFSTESTGMTPTTGWGRGVGGVGVYESPTASGGGGVYFTQGEYAYPWHPSNGLNQNTTTLMRTATDTGMDIPSLTMLPFGYIQSWSNPTHWMVYGGWTGPAYHVSPGIRSGASKTTWSTETDSELPSSTGENLSGAGSNGNNTYGYAGGGRTTSPGDNRSYVLRYTFESDTFEFRPSSNLTGTRKFLAGTSAKEHANPQPTYPDIRPNVI